MNGARSSGTKVFNYDFFDRFLDVAADMGMKVIFVPRRLTPPAWLTEKYPEVLNANMDGVLYRHGGRRHYNYNSPKYQELTRIIVENLHLIMQNIRQSSDGRLIMSLTVRKMSSILESDTIAFRKFLMEKYGSIDALNEAWGTNFWNQTYNSFEEVYVPRTTLSNNTNPHEVLDYTRFVSDSACKFAKLQSDIIRKYIKPGDFITTNGLFGNLDNQRMTNESLDFITYDSYPNFAYCLDAYNKDNFLKDRMWSRNPSEVRAVSKTSVSWNSSPEPTDGIPVWQLRLRSRDR